MNEAPWNADTPAVAAYLGEVPGIRAALPKMGGDALIGELRRALLIHRGAGLPLPLDARPALAALLDNLEAWKRRSALLPFTVHTLREKGFDDFRVEASSAFGLFEAFVEHATPRRLVRVCVRGDYRGW